MSLGRLNEDFRDLLVEFSDEGVEFLLVGAFAVAFHGVHACNRRHGRFHQTVE